MPVDRVVILSSQSLYTEGVLSRLKEYQDELDLQVVDAKAEEALTQIVKLDPSAVIIDTTDKVAATGCPLGELLDRLPSLRIIRLNPGQQGFQLVTSETREAKEVHDLIAVIGSSDPARDTGS
jgi:DNA-binding NarL/FixJ family response regulator